MYVNPRFFEVRFDDTRRALFDLVDGRSLAVPLEWFPLLAAAPKDAREDYEIEDDGRVINWPDLGERVSIDAVMLVRFPAEASA